MRDWLQEVQVEQPDQVQVSVLGLVRITVKVSSQSYGLVYRQSRAQGDRTHQGAG